ncbi:alcohol dehydrogenase catalytic domain-containing protein [Streptomyces sp. NPDC002896]|uniref:alcohol dehydrogenase catalytic domain-containing protein n=1 Tax=Streptomyces sp. NPDC002896 TaxID=3154438 RepID=UPI003325574D
MRAFGFKSNGGPDVLQEIEVPTPAPGLGQVLIEVAYAGVNFAEVQHRRGEFGEPDGPGGYDVPGLEVSGTVVALGTGAAGPAVGEQVAAYLPAFGGYAEFAVADTDFVRPVSGSPWRTRRECRACIRRRTGCWRTRGGCAAVGPS